MSEPVPVSGWLRRLGPQLRPHRRLVATSVGAGVLAAGATAATPVVERTIVDDVVLAHRLPLAPWLGLLVGLGVVAFGTARTRRFYSARTVLEISYQLRNALHDQLQRLDLANHNDLPAGQLVSRASADV